MKIRHYKQGIVTMLAPESPVVDDGVGELAAKIDECVSDGDLRLVIDLNKVPVIESAGLELLVKKSRDLAARGGALKISNPSEICRDVLRVTRLTRVLEIYETPDDARRSFI